MYKKIKCLQIALISSLATVTLLGVASFALAADAAKTSAPTPIAAQAVPPLPPGGNAMPGQPGMPPMPPGMPGQPGMPPMPGQPGMPGFAPPQPQAQSQPSLMGMIVPFALMFVIIYFLMIRPQQKKMKEHKAMVESIKAGDEVVTTSGILGKITGVADKVVTVEIADGVKVKVLKGQVAQVVKGQIKDLT